MHQYFFGGLGERREHSLATESFGFRWLRAKITMGLSHRKPVQHRNHQICLDRGFFYPNKKRPDVLSWYKIMEDVWTFTFGGEVGKMINEDTCLFWTETEFQIDRATSPQQFRTTWHHHSGPWEANSCSTNLQHLGRPTVIQPTDMLERRAAQGTLVPLE